jgi:superfamily II DNA or RNA helicase
MDGMHQTTVTEDPAAPSEAAILRAVGVPALQNGRRYLAAGAVTAFRLAPDGLQAEARVKGTQRRPYRTEVRLVDQAPPRERLIVGTCTCPVGMNCKHVAAVLLAWRREVPRRGTDHPAAASTPTPVPAIPPEVDAWLRSVARAEADESEDYPPGVRKRLIYVLGLHDRTLRLRLAAIELRRDGTTGESTTQSLAALTRRGATPPRFVRPSDQAILQRLPSSDLIADLGEDDQEAMLRQILATGRARWETPDGPVLTEGESLPGTLAWRLREDGTQVPAVEVPGGLACIGGSVPWYVDPAQARLGPVRMELSPRLLRAILAAPPLPRQAAQVVREELGRRLPGRSVPPPLEVAPPRRVDAKPQPVLVLHQARLPYDPRLPAWEPRHAAAVPAAGLSFRYAEVEISPTLEGNTLVQAGEMLEIARDPTAERGAATRLADAGLRAVSLNRPPRPHSQLLLMHAPSLDRVEDWAAFLLEELPRLRQSGWDVRIEDDFPIRLLQPDGDLIADLEPGDPPDDNALSQGSGIDWFELQLGVMVEGIRVDLVKPLQRLLAGGTLPDARAKTLLVPIEGGRRVALPLDRLRPVMGVLLELFAGGSLDQADDRLRLPRLAAAELVELEERSGLDWRGGEAVRALGRQLRDRGGIPVVPLPEGFAATLRPYQARGVDWLQFLREAGLSGVLADDMGLGKTVQALAHLAIEQAAGRLAPPALVVCPTSLVGNWQSEAAHFAPRLRVLALHGPERARHFAAIDGHDVVITTYPLLFRDQEVLTARDWSLVLLDEAQSIKNPAATTSKLARRLRAGQRLCLSGTPMENHLGELWSLFDFLMPGFLGSAKDFQRRFRTPIEKAGDAPTRTMLARRIAPFLLRRTKREVAAELPDKTEITEPVEMETAQRSVYEGIRMTMHARVRAAIAERGLARSGIIILDALLKLRQACCDPRLLKLKAVQAARARSAKLERLMQMLPELLEDGRQVLVFSQFTSMLALIGEALDAAGIGYVLLTGDTRDRATPIRRFQSGEVKLFLISLKAGGVGLNLTAADTVIHYDPWWNPAVEDQATDRAHRIGQQRAVFVHRLVTLGTIEEKMQELKSRKQALVAGILDAGRETALAMTEADIEEIFG